jgi:1-acyl-sn-glycerol-3-phosphate acyltransferase
MAEPLNRADKIDAIDAATAASQLLAVLAPLLRGAVGDAALATLDLDCRLDADLGLDSLGRTELLTRLEQRFGVRLPEQALLAETPRALLAFIVAADTQQPMLPSCVAPAEALEATAPGAAQTLLEALQWHLQRQPERIHIEWYGDGAAAEPITYRDLWQTALRVAGGLQRLGVRPGDRVALMLPSGPDYFHSFFGALVAGAVPVPIYPPTRPSQLDEHLLRHARILDNAGVCVLVSFAQAMTVGHLLKTQAACLRHLVSARELSTGADGVPHQASADALAFLQYTSGSTGDPKGVMLTHTQLLANIRAMGQAVEVSSADVFVSWLPLYHDMGLIGAWLGSLYFGCRLVVMSPLRFLARPAQWLWALHRHRGSLSAAPNFAYELCLSRISPSELQGLDLSAWRWAFNGAEPVNPDTMRRFAERFAAYGLRSGALAPVYGLAEAAVGLAFPPPGRGMRVDAIDRDRLRRHGEAFPLPSSHPRAQHLAGCGYPLPGYQVQVLDEANAALPERREGRLVFRGPSATAGYFDNPAASAALYCGDWLETGDRAYLADGEIFISGRVKEMIIRGGRNIFPYELEQAISALADIRSGCVAVFAATDRRSASERLVIVAETRQHDAARREQLRLAVRALSEQLLGEPVDDLVLAPPHTVLKTSSGKIRRAELRERYEAGQLERKARAPWWQLTRVAAVAAVTVAKRWTDGVVAWLYALYALSVFAALVPGVWLGVVLLPRLSQRWRLIRGAIRLLRRATAVPLRVEGVTPPAPVQVWVCNHASYLDVLALIEALPGQPVYVAKRELEQNGFTRLFLQRLHTLFVERFDVRKSAAEVERFAQALRAGQSLVFFPEGTFRSEPGLLPFRMGAFLAAAEAGAPLLAAALSGSRDVLRAGDWRPRRGAIRLTLSAPLQAAGVDWGAALELRAAAREFIVRHCGEADLAAPGR